MLWQCVRDRHLKSLHNDHSCIHQDGYCYQRFSSYLPSIPVPLLVKPTPTIYNTSVIDYRKTSNEPRYSYAKLISMFIEKSSEEKIELPHINMCTENICTNYQTIQTNWYTLIHHNVCLNKGFRKLPSWSCHQNGKCICTSWLEAKCQITQETLNICF